MRRPRKSVPVGLRIEKNFTNEFYETTENGITYSLPYFLLDHIKRWFPDAGSVEQWYRDLCKEDRKAVIRSGVPDNTEHFNDGFHYE